jgi:hypothetical protein
VGVRAATAACVLAALVVSTAPADAQRTRFQGITQCGRFATMQFARRDPAFRRFVIERVSVQDEKYADMVGNQYVSTVYYGRATYDGAGGSRRVRFVCLYAGYSKGAVFVFTIPDTSG